MDLRDSKQAARFDYPVTWSTLVDPKGPAPFGSKGQVAKTARRNFDSSFQWSMVVPRFTPASPGTHLLTAGGEAAIAQFDVPKYVVPKFEVSTPSASLAVKLVLSVSLAMLLVPGWRNIGSAGARAVEVESTLSQRGWIHSSPGLLLYLPSLDKADYRIEFNWPASPQGVAWVFRAKDDKNYYGVRIKPVSPEDLRKFSIERIAMYRGVQNSRMVRTVMLPQDDPIARVKLDVNVSAFTLSLNGKTVSQWTDPRLTSGGVGFLQAGTQRAAVQSLRISLAP
jgi:hypothetical protein